MNNRRERIQALLTEMGRGAYEREEVIALTLLTAIAGESMFLLGLPGVGKSMVARRLKMAFSQGRSFEYLMSRFSTPDEIFGPVSISKLKENDSYERVTDGYLPTADVVFLDEIWKAGPAIQNALLTVLNEKIFRNGKEDLLLPLKVVISASNELPAEGEGLEAIWDRFLMRYIVKPIGDRDLFLNLLFSTPEECHIPETLKLSNEELSEMQQQIRQIAVPREIQETLYSIRKALVEKKQQMEDGVDVTQSEIVEPPYVSDRRWKKVVGIMKASAYLNGRDYVDYSDCLLMDHMLWDKDEQVNSVKKLLAEAIVKNIRHNKADGIIGSIQGKSYTKPVGTPISPDGIHYIFRVGDEEIKIEKTQYNKLVLNRKVYGIMTSDDKLIISEVPTSLAVRKTTDGLSINSFSYSLKRDSTLRSGSVEGMMKNATDSISNMEEMLKEQVNGNMFLPGYSRYSSLINAFSASKNKLIRKGY